jgi:hypothetical protein
MEFISKINTLRAGPRDMLVSFDVVSLFTMVPTEGAPCLLSQHFDEAILQLLNHVLTSSFSASMASSMSKPTVWRWVRRFPGIAHDFMEYFEEMALEKATYKPLCWFHYVDTFVIWPHGPG